MDTVVQGLAKVSHSFPLFHQLCVMHAGEALCQHTQMFAGTHQKKSHVNACFQAPAGDYPPYPVWGGNEYQGWLWTMENDKFDRSNVRPSRSTRPACLSQCKPCLVHLLSCVAHISLPAHVSGQASVHCEVH